MFKQFISNLVIVKRFVELAELENAAKVAVSHYRMFSQTKGNIKSVCARRHHDAVVKYNQKKFFFMKRLQFEI